jgi:hypothetical protein
MSAHPGERAARKIKNSKDAEAGAHFLQHEFSILAPRHAGRVVLHPAATSNAGKQGAQ